MRELTKRAGQDAGMTTTREPESGHTLISVKNYVGEEKSSTDVSVLLYESTVSFSRKN
ncbi:Hypothetical protein HEAR2480 [Herminiimonas arsenicoxydans]|uniref:Uncharacterized protein n=1 Tax=Herminiimonas arsenicoxydans TaxID=204773 RepID=A4G7X1_HERAR|nr:Hypothetical protein HEAR2480 [Herminiimonas arsenicoxydans]